MKTVGYKDLHIHESWVKRCFEAFSSTTFSGPAKAAWSHPCVLVSISIICNTLSAHPHTQNNPWLNQHCSLLSSSHDCQPIIVCILLNSTVTMTAPYISCTLYKQTSAGRFAFSPLLDQFKSQLSWHTPLCKVLMLEPATTSIAHCILCPHWVTCLYYNQSDGCDFTLHHNCILQLTSCVSNRL